MPRRKTDSPTEQRALQRRTLKRAAAEARASDHHHNVYVVLLESSARSKLRGANSNADPKKPCVYVGMSGLSPEERFARHKAGIQCSRVVRDFGVRLIPELYQHLNPMPYAAAAAMERDLAEDLRAAGYAVAGGH